MEKFTSHASEPFRRSCDKYIKSALNYFGGKYKLLSQILLLFPYRIDTFADLFMGGCNVAINVNAKHYYCNDLNTPILELIKMFHYRKIGNYG